MENAIIPSNEDMTGPYAMLADHNGIDRPQNKELYIAKYM